MSLLREFLTFVKSRRSFHDFDGVSKGASCAFFGGLTAQKSAVLRKQTSAARSQKIAHLNQC